MKAEGAKKQTAFLTGVNAAVRAMGLLMRVMLSRLLGPEIMGITELAQSVHMLAITPLTSGLPLAISRMTAKAGLSNKRKPLLAGLMLVRSASVGLIPALLVFAAACPDDGRCAGAAVLVVYRALRAHPGVLRGV